MAAPFTPFETFVDDSTPSISAAFLNGIQEEGIAPAAAAAYWAFPRCTHKCDDAATIKIQPTQVILKDSSTSKYTFVNVPYTELTVADLVPAAANFAASSWYYLYAVATSGVLSIEISATAPDTASQLTFQSGDETRRYLGCFRTDNSGGATGIPIPYLCTRGRFIYDENFFVFTGGSATSFTTVALNSASYRLIPPHVEHALLRVSNNAAYSVAFRPPGTTYTSSARQVAAYSQDAFLEMRCDNTQSVDYKVSSMGGSVDLSVVGFVEG